MAHQITKDDKVVVYKQQAWHGLAEIVEEYLSPGEAIRKALPWKVKKLIVAAVDSDGTTINPEDLIPIEEKIAICRMDTKRILGFVGKDYHILQNDEFAYTIEECCKEGLIPKVESVGSVKWGSIVFCLVKINEFEVGKGDMNYSYIAFNNGFDGTTALTVTPTSIRQVCWNTTMMILGQKNCYSCRHTPNLKERVEEIKNSLLGINKVQVNYKEKADWLFNKEMNKKDCEQFFFDLYKKQISDFKVNPKNRGEENSKTRAENTIGEWMANFELPSENNIRGTRWGVLNAVTRWADHKRTVRVTESFYDEKEARTYSRLFGDSAKFKVEAMNSILQLA